jgi:hypothetical protein
LKYLVIIGFAKNLNFGRWLGKKVLRQLWIEGVKKIFRVWDFSYFVTNLTMRLLINPFHNSSKTSKLKISSKNWNWLLFRRKIEKKSEEFQISHQWYLLFRQYVWIFHN